MKKINIFLFFLVIIFLFSCKENLKFLIVIDNSENVVWRQNDFLNPIKSFFNNKFNDKINYFLITEKGAFDKLMIRNSYYLSRVKGKDPKAIGFVMCVKPYLNRKIETVEYKLTLSTTYTEFKDVTEDEKSAKFFFKETDKKDFEYVTIPSPLEDGGEVLLRKRIIRYDMANEYEINSETISYSKKIVKELNNKFEKKNFKEIFVESHKFFIWGKDLKTKLIILNDTKNKIEWDYDGYKDKIEEIVKNSFPKRDVITEEYAVYETIGSVRTKILQYIEPALEEEDIDYCIFSYVRPFKNPDFRNDEFEYILATSKNYNNSPNYSDDQILDISLLLEKINSLLIDSLSRYNFDLLSSPLVWRYANRVRNTNIIYKSYSEIIKTDGMFILIQSIPDILKNGKFNVDEILTDNKFVIENSKKIKDIVDFFNNSKLSYLFYSEDGTLLNRNLILFEFVRTGGKDIRLLFGPIEEKDFNLFQVKFKEKGVEIFNEPVFTYDFR